MTTAIFFGLVWGGLWVVIGVGVDLVILLLVLEWSAWTPVAGVIAASSVGVIVRSLYNEHHEDIA